MSMISEVITKSNHTDSPSGSHSQQKNSLLYEGRMGFYYTRKSIPEATSFRSRQRADVDANSIGKRNEKHLN